MRVLGIDPGINGAISLLADGRVLFVTKLPTHDDPWGKRVIDGAFLHKFLGEWGAFDLIVMERVHSRPGDGHVGAFSFGRTFGNLETVIALLPALNFLGPSPQVWKAAILHDTDKSKQAAVDYVKKHYPKAKIGDDHDMAESICLAEYGQRYLTNGS